MKQTLSGAMSRSVSLESSSGWAPEVPPSPTASRTRAGCCGRPVAHQVDEPEGIDGQQPSQQAQLLVLLPTKFLVVQVPLQAALDELAVRLGDLLGAEPEFQHERVQPVDLFAVDLEILDGLLDRLPVARGCVDGG